jgi:ABC-type dipeptide/oligopeptide/nickel transport system permease component
MEEAGEAVIRAEAPAPGCANVAVGVGRVDAIYQRHYPIAQGVDLLVASIIVRGNPLADLTDAYRDPRIRCQ